MARKGRQDRGLLSKKDSTGKLVWYVRLYHEGRERRFGSFKTKTEARDFYEKAKQEQKEERFFPETYQRNGHPLVQAVIDEYMLTAATTNKKSLPDERYFARWWGQRFHKKRLSAITPRSLEPVRQDLLAQGLTPQRVNRYMAWLRHKLNLAGVKSNPVAKVKMFKEPKGKTRFLSPEEESKLMTALGEKYAPWARLGILTGMRQAEQFSLRWENVNLDLGIITLPTTKSGDVQYVHLNEEACGILRLMDTWQRSVWVFPSENPRTHMGARNFYGRIWMPAVKKTGIEWATWHDLRHTYASRLAMSGQTEGTIATLLRHSTTALVKRYAHLSGSHLRAAVEGVSKFGKGANPRTSLPQNEPISISTVTQTGIPDDVEKAGVS